MGNKTCPLPFTFLIGENQKEVRELAQGQLVGQWWNMESNTNSLTPEAVFSTTHSIWRDTGLF